MRRPVSTPSTRPIAALCGVLACLFFSFSAPATADEVASDAVPAAAGEAAPEAEAFASAEPETPPKPPLVVEAEELLAEQEELVAQFRPLNDQADQLEGDERRLVEHQLAEMKLEYLKITNALTKNILAQEKAGIDATPTRAVFEKDFKDLAGAIVRHIDASEDELRELRKQLVTAGEEEILRLEEAIDNELQWGEFLYEGYVKHLLDLEALGMAAADVRTDVTQRLSARADRLAGRIQLATDQIERLERRIAENPGDAAALAEVHTLKRRRTSATERIAIVAALMDSVGLDSSRYRQLLIQTTGEVTTDVFKGRVALGLLEEAVESTRVWLRRNAPGLIFKLISFIVILVVFRILAGITRRIVERGMSGGRARGSVLVQKMLEALAGRVVMLVGLMVAISQLGVELGPMLAGLGIAGFIVGFALQDSLSNFAAGIMILGYQPFDVDDFIEAGGVFGRVSHMSLVSTTILTIDNQTLIVPNSKIWGDVIKNVTHQTQRRVDMKFYVAHDEDLERIETLFGRILDEHPRILKDPEPVVKLHKIRENALEFIVRPWVATEDYWDVHWDVTREVKRRFDEARVRIPHPQRDVHLFPVPSDG